MKRDNAKQPIRPRPRQSAELAPAANFPAGDVRRSSRGVLLHPTDYSEPSRQAFELACQIARDSGSRLVVMHAAEPVRISSLGMAPAPPLPKGYRGAWESRLRLMQPRDPAVPVEHRLEEGDVASAILRVAREVRCDLVVMSGRERTWLGRLLKGSITGEVEHEAPCPVLRLNTHGISSYRRDDMLDFRTILHPTDFSAPAMYAFGLARTLALAADSELLVIHVAPAGHSRKRRRRREMYEALRRLTEADRNVRIRSLLLEGDASSQIACTASQLDCDLIVMGTNGRTGLRRLLVGSVAGAVRRDAPCPVVTVQLPARDGWELPDFADEEVGIGTESVRPLGVTTTRQTGGMGGEPGGTSNPARPRGRRGDRTHRESNPAPAEWAATRLSAGGP
jgi:nucleotide-binding universal stress UspA family protein